MLTHVYCYILIMFNLCFSEALKLAKLVVHFFQQKIARRIGLPTDWAAVQLTRFPYRIEMGTTVSSTWRPDLMVYKY